MLKKSLHGFFMDCFSGLFFSSLLKEPSGIPEECKFGATRFQVIIKGFRLA